jgi:DNA-binding MarR family transcriptional regulator
MPKPSSSSLLTLDNQLCFAVHAAAHAFAQAYRPLLRPLRLTYPQYLVMLLLWEEDDRTVGELGAALRLDSGTLSPLLKRLAAAGYVARARDPNDERVTRVALTARGAALKKKAARAPEAMLAACGLELDRLAELRDEMRRLGDALRAAARGQRPSSRLAEGGRGKRGGRPGAAVAR